MTLQDGTQGNLKCFQKFIFLVFHGTQFIERWHKVGLMGEHGLESVHHIMNDEFRSLN